MSSRSNSTVCSQRGVALVVALLVFALCATLMVGLQRNFDLAYRRAANSFLGEQAWSYLLGAEELATLALSLDFDSDTARDAPRDDLTELWARQATPYALDEGGWMFGQLVDLQGRFNLNALASGGLSTGGPAAYSPAQQLFIRLLQALETPQIDQFQAVAITESIADWIDADEQLRLNGAEASYYVGLTPSYRPANQVMMDVSELRAIANVTPELYAALRPMVTSWPREPAAINIHTASLPLLRAINGDSTLTPLARADGERLFEQRTEEGFESLDAFLQNEVFSGVSLEAAATLLGESSSYFLLRARVEIAEREQRLYSVLYREARQVSVLQRKIPSFYDTTYDDTDAATEASR